MEVVKDLEKRKYILEQAVVPGDTWKQCVVLESGTIFTSEDNYKAWLENKDKHKIPQLTLEQKLVKELAETKLSIIEIKSKLGGEI